MRHLIRWAQPIVLLLALIFIALLLRSQWDELHRYTWHIMGRWLLLSGGLMVAGWFVEVGIWRATLAWVGGRMDYPTAVRIWFASILVRYIPGNVWQPLGMTVLAQQVGVRPVATVASIALYQAVNLLSAAPFLALYLLAAGASGITVLGQFRLSGLAPWLALLASIPLLTFLIRPGWLIVLLNRGLVWLGREALSARLTSAQLLALLCVGLVDWLLAGGSFVALILGLHPFHLTELGRMLPLIIAAYPVAYAIGYLSFLTPGGLAVREGALFVLLTPVLGGLVMVAALVMRLWQVVLEVLIAGIVALITRQRTGAIGPTQPHEGTRRI